MTPQQIENTKTIVEFLGGKVEISYENKTSGHIDYSIHGQVVEEWRAMGLSVGGYKDKMMLVNCKFHSSWDWIMLVLKALYKKWIFITNSPDLLDAILELNIEKAFNEITDIINLYNKEELENKKWESIADESYGAMFDDGEE